jgi:hypothetical protein
VWRYGAPLRQRWIWRSGRTCLGASRPSSSPPGTPQFTRFTSTKVQIRSGRTCLGASRPSFSPPGTQFTSFTSTKVQILTPEGCSTSSSTAQSSSSSSSGAPRGLVPLLLASVRLSGTRSAPAASASQQHTSAYVSIRPHTSASQQPASASQQHAQRAREEEEAPPTRTTHPRAPSALWRACVQLLVHSLLAFLLAFSCFSGTTVQILTRRKSRHMLCLVRVVGRDAAQFTGFTGTKVQILTQKAALGAHCRPRRCGGAVSACILSLLALLVQKYQY